MDNIKDQTNENQQDGQQTERIYSQKEVDDIVSKRLARERRKYEREYSSGVDDERERALNARELKLTAREKLINKGMPSELADILKYDDEESFEEAINVIKSYKGEPQSGRSWGDRLTGSPRRKTDQFRDAMGLVGKE